MPDGIGSYLPGRIAVTVLVLYLGGCTTYSKHATSMRDDLLMIDEAQNLSPEVLEQVRLLTNLETDKHKLLQIFLVGQPELRELLQQRGLRQLAQRITARYHLGPLKRRETRAYVRHRLRVAGAERELFTGPALRLVHRRTGGVPRLINILCERALLGAYATGRQQATWSIVARAARELAGNSGRRSPPPDGLARLGAWALTAFVALSLGFAGYWLGSTESTNPVVALSQPTPGRPENVPISPIYASAVEPLDAVADPVAHLVFTMNRTLEPAHHLVDAEGQVGDAVDQGPVHIKQQCFQLGHFQSLSDPSTLTVSKTNRGLPVPLLIRRNQACSLSQCQDPLYPSAQVSCPN